MSNMNELSLQKAELVSEQLNTIMDVPSPIVENNQNNMLKIMEMADFLSKSNIVPSQYMHRPENCYIALDMANRMGVPALMVMQNLYVVQGKPSFSGASIGAIIRANPNFKNVRVNYVGEKGKDSRGAFISALNVALGEVIEGSTVTIETAKKEGWYQKNGSKWQTMPELMLAYRAYAYFGRVYLPEVMMGMHSSEEVNDMSQERTEKVVNPYGV